MKLYWAPKTRSFRIVWLMEETGQPYERVLVDLAKEEQKKPAFLKINPMGKVPALADGEVSVSESAAICCYVADRYKEARLAPSLDDPKRGAYLRWMFFAAGCVEAAFAQKFAKFELPPQSAGWGSFDQVFNVLEEALQPGPWLLGGQFTAADIMIGSDLHFAVDLLKIVPECPAFRAYLKRCAERPAFRRAQEIDAKGA